MVPVQPNVWAEKGVGAHTNLRGTGSSFFDVIFLCFMLFYIVTASWEPPTHKKRRVAAWHHNAGIYGQHKHACMHLAHLGAHGEAVDGVAQDTARLDKLARQLGDTVWEWVPDGVASSAAGHLPG